MAPTQAKESEKQKDTSSSQSADNSIVLAPIYDLSTPRHLAEIISRAARQTRKRLIVILVSDIFDPHIVSHTETWDNVQSLLTFVYVQAMKEAQALDRILMDVDVLLKGTQEQLPHELINGVDIIYCAQSNG